MDRYNGMGWSPGCDDAAVTIDWFVVTCEDEAIHLSVRPPGQDS
jgi:hypothetical protein